ncbi:MAG TPA: hypothetical protein VN914_20330, partial [Polyangia bacterium]|nr:hypothetical protein [Polyangia bacterium]
PRATRLDEAAAGVEREVFAGTPAGVELLLRRARLGAAAPAVEREGLLALHLHHRRRAYKLSAMYQGRLHPTRSELFALGSLGLTSWLSAGVLVLHAPRSTWAPLFDEARAGPLAPADGSGWLLGIQLHAELGQWLGVRSALWLDALNLAGDRGAVAVREGAPVPMPRRQVRLGLRVEY